MISALLKPGDFILISSLTSKSNYATLPELEQIFIEAVDFPEECHLLSIVNQPLMMFLEKTKANANDKKKFYNFDKKDKILVLINDRLFQIYDENTLYFGKRNLNL